MQTTTAVAPERRLLPTTMNAYQRLMPRLEERSSGGPKIVGYGAVFYNPADPGTEYVMGGGIAERIMPGAFKSALNAGADVRSLFNHDPNFPLGRTTAGTLRLSVDSRGLKYEVTPPASRADVIEALRRGDVSGSSFMFVPLSQNWIDGPNGTLVREIFDLELWEVGPVVFPAYASADSGLSRVEPPPPQPPLSAGQPHGTRPDRNGRRKAMAMKARLAEVEAELAREKDRQDVADRMRQIEAMEAQEVEETVRRIDREEINATMRRVEADNRRFSGRTW